MSERRVGNGSCDNAQFEPSESDIGPEAVREDFASIYPHYRKARGSMTVRRLQDLDLKLTRSCKNSSRIHVAADNIPKGNTLTWSSQISHLSISALSESPLSVFSVLVGPQMLTFSPTD